ncbi:hypothetical protein [Rhabdothermincola salaria]|uniref:hypothetical protein n=1 Tax=Rhabdothermincola salaria TaxID=2903142 RepID=UPI001E35F52E|nr:hypothetical protein [Rhabdothermincola salaria]MCD9625266.1 hypothetical protein [Rhabdothermincola salaria]
MTATTPVVVTGSDELIANWDRGELVHFGAPGAQVLRASNWRNDRLTRVQHLYAAELDVTDAVWRCGLILARSRLDTVSMRRCRSADVIVIEDCTIDVLDIRELRGGVALNRCQIGQLVVHGAAQIAASDVIATHVRVTDIGDAVDVSALTCETLRIAESSGADTTSVSLVDLKVRDELRLENLTAVNVATRRVTAGAILFRDVIAEEVVVADSHATRVSVTRLRAAAGKTCPVTIGGSVTSSVEIQAASTDRPAVDLTMRGLRVSGDLLVAGSMHVALETGRVDGTLRRDHVRNSGTTVVADSAFEIATVEVPETRIRNRRQALATATALLGHDGPTALATLRRSLDDRPREQDQVYFAERCANGRRGWGRVPELGQRWTFGYGVRLAEPLAFLVGGIILTAVVIGVAAPEVVGPNDDPSWGRTVALAAQLWFNVGVGLPEAARGPGWAITAVLLTTLGLVFVTTLIGIGIRRLVR